ncbi:Coadhesin,Thrombospondin-1,Adhesion G protein-coupled receptor B1,Mucin-like protein,Hemicentin-1,Thrombospondin-2 [Mytilus coruscus]|uniref:Coadhesin,Thrombospondin-1,Adhesion G protein-coupled receptor B1,Mucin-like protein,Hemicentin-1,Thrombospondin-2 n=1 Tax=Mytilus coruscus TaxID=42192 RepID=A0A6J8AV28_MYTCO|nr:Coadhesin,Thrombospondin-1,Adhesion G protein-coupled receptor B1,Mucin-like protein,Hemicentin-1,Thrombospondin-2 [Mytilus coruscus]
MEHFVISYVLTLFVSIYCIVYGGWTDFGPWGVCSKTCGGGQQSRTRTCTNPSPAYGGEECQGSSQEIISCQEQHCPVDGGLTDFGPWGVCSKTCGGGLQSRTRTCTNPSPAYGGNECQESNQETHSCQEQHCLVDGGWTDFGPWGVCSKTCGGGLQSRTRTCTNPSPAYGGNECQESNQETQSCQEQHCPVDGGLTDFGPWGVCSKTCGGGLQSRTRTCTNPSPAYGGNECQESNQETQSCQEQHCPVDGGLTDFGPWGVCSKTCGGGLQSRTRTCTNPSPAYGGNECQESNQETQSCQEQHCPVDGGWTDFGLWGVCSKTCGGGLQSRTRTCTNPSPAYGGNECQESNQETQSCQEQHCPASVDPQCVAKANRGDCQFYRCFEQQRQCGKSGYLIGYGYKYCNRFKSFYSSFTTAGKKWIDCVRPCLTKALIGKYQESLGPGQKCNQLKTYAFDTHVKCYLDCGFCDVYTSNISALGRVFSFSDLLSTDAWKQIIKVGKECIFG